MAGFGWLTSEPFMLPMYARDQRLRERYVGRILSRLSDRERQIIIRRFGLNYEDEPRTLKQVGAELGVSIGNERRSRP